MASLLLISRLLNVIRGGIKNLSIPSKLGTRISPIHTKPEMYFPLVGANVTEQVTVKVLGQRMINFSNGINGSHLWFPPRLPGLMIIDQPNCSETMATSRETTSPFLVFKEAVNVCDDLRHFAIQAGDYVMEFSHRGLEINGQERAKDFDILYEANCDISRFSALMHGLHTESVKHTYEGKSYHCSAFNCVHFTSNVATFLGLGTPGPCKKLLYYSFLVQSTPGIKHVRNWDQVKIIICLPIAGGAGLLVATAAYIYGKSRRFTVRRRN